MLYKLETYRVIFILQLYSWYQHQVFTVGFLLSNSWWPESLTVRCQNDFYWRNSNSTTCCLFTGVRYKVCLILSSTPPILWLKYFYIIDLCVNLCVCVCVFQLWYEQCQCSGDGSSWSGLGCRGCWKTYRGWQSSHREGGSIFSIISYFLYHYY